MYRVQACVDQTRIDGHYPNWYWRNEEGQRIFPSSASFLPGPAWFKRVWCEWCPVSCTDKYVTKVCMYVCMYACMYMQACMYVRMQVCMYVCIEYRSSFGNPWSPITPPQPGGIIISGPYKLDQAKGGNKLTNFAQGISSSEERGGGGEGGRWGNIRECRNAWLVTRHTDRPAPWGNRWKRELSDFFLFESLVFCCWTWQLASMFFDP